MKMISKLLIYSASTYLILASVASAQSSHAEVNAGVVAQLEEIKEQIKSIRGDIERLQFDNTQLTDKLTKLSTDTEYRFNHLDKKKPEVVAEADVPKEPAKLAEAPKEAKSEESSQAKKDMEKEYQEAYSTLKERDYPKARTLFQKFLENHPNSELAGSARFWIGETYFSQEAYDKAAVEYLKGYQANVTGPRAPENLLKLAKSMEKLDNRTGDACLTLLKLKKEFPKAQNNIKKQMNDDIKALKCK